MDTSTNGFYIIVFKSGTYTLHENITIDGNIITDCELVVKAKYICSMQIDTNWYGNQRSLWRMKQIGRAWCRSTYGE